MARGSQPRQLLLFDGTADPKSAATRGGSRKGIRGFSDSAFTDNVGEPLHRWVPWIAGFSARFVREVLESRLPLERSHRKSVLVLDPFAGVGTTLIEGCAAGCNVLGFEINPYAAFAATVKLESVRVNLSEFKQCIRRYDAYMHRASNLHPCAKKPQSTPPPDFKTRTPFYSPDVERKVLRTLDFIEELTKPQIRDLFRLAFASVMVEFSNYSYEPSLTRRSVAGKTPVEDADVGGVVRRKLMEMHLDIGLFKALLRARGHTPESRVINSSFFLAGEHLQGASVDLVVTSPPYVNNYHYLRNTRPHLHWLGFVERSRDLKVYEEASFGTFWQTVRHKPSVRLEFELPALDALLATMRRRNNNRGVYGGKGWANYAATYFNDAYRFCGVLAHLLQPGAHAVIVIGNSVLQGIEVRTDELFADIGKQCGLQVEGIHLLRSKRTGSSIINSSVRANHADTKVTLYESAVDFRRPVTKLDVS